jgi:hypothetical protein
MKNETDTYDGSMPIRDALQAYFSKYHFAEGGYNQRFFKIKLGRLFIPLPNIKARVDAVKIHDVHHLLTGYSAHWKGEVQIGAWEIASGCGPYYVAWLLNLGSFMVGMFLFPSALLKAFLRGRSAKTNLYHSITYNDELLRKTVGELREYIDTDRPTAHRTTDYILFGSWCIAGFAFLCVEVFIVCFAALLVIRLF